MSGSAGVPGELSDWSDRLEMAVIGTCFREVRVYAECSSTQEPARDLGPGVVVTTGRQTDGRGRRGSAWEDGEGRSISVSLTVHAEDAARLCTATALGVLDAVERLHGGPNPELGVKFPNDLVHRDGRKLAGILVEGDGACAVIGIGLNVHTRDWPSEYRGVSLEELGITGTRIDVLETLVPAVSDRLQADDVELADAYGRRHLPTGRRVRLEHDGRELEGHLERIDPFNQLALRMPSETLRIPVAQCRMLSWVDDRSD